MRFTLVVLATSVTLVACGGGGDKSANTAATSSGASTGVATPAASSAATTGAAPAAAASAGTPAPITGKTYEVKMIGDEKGYRFDPATLTIKVGDGIKFVNVTGGPHNLAFNKINLNYFQTHEPNTFANCK